MQSEKKKMMPNPLKLTFASLELMCFEILTTTILEIALLRAAGLLENFPSCFCRSYQRVRSATADLQICRKIHGLGCVTRALMRA